jgi:hypothetical protein
LNEKDEIIEYKHNTEDFDSPEEFERDENETL